MTFLSLPTSSQPLARAKYSKLCWVKESPGVVASVMPATPSLFSVRAAVSIASYVVGGCRFAAWNRSLR